MNVIPVNLCCVAATHDVTVFVVFCVSSKPATLIRILLKLPDTSKFAGLKSLGTVSCSCQVFKPKVAY